MTQPLQPPAESVLTLEAPAPSKAVAATAAPKMAPAVDPAVVPQLDAKVDQFIGALDGVAAKSPEFDARAADIRTMGDRDIRSAAETSNRLLKQPVKALQDGAVSKESKVSKTLLELRRTVEDLDPGQAKGAKKILGRIPFGGKLTDYFRKYCLCFIK